MASDKTRSGIGLPASVFSGAQPYRESLVVYEKENNPQQILQTLDERIVEFWKMFSHFQKPNEEMKRISEINY